MIEDMDGMETDQIGAIVRKGTSILVRRACGFTAAPPPNVAVQLDLPPLPPIDRTTVDTSEKLSDKKARWIKLGGVEGMYGCGRDKALELANEAGAAIQIGSTWWVDRTRLSRVIKTQFP